MSRGLPRATRRTSRSPRALRAGLSLVEVLIALAITAMLLTAVAAAYSASARAIEINDQFFRASQAARVSVNRIVADLRKADSGGVSPDGKTLTITFPGGEQRTYTYNAAAKTLTLTKLVETGPQTFSVASNVKSASFYSDGDSVGMNIIIAVGSHEIVLSGSAIPRRRMTYQ